jgi:hypothetical protein
MKTCSSFFTYLTKYFSERNMFRPQVVETNETHMLCPVHFQLSVIVLEVMKLKGCYILERSYASSTVNLEHSRS